MEIEIPEGYKQTKVGLIPENWQPHKIGDVATFSGGSQPPRSTFVFKPKIGYLRLIQIRDYKTDAYETYIPEELAKKKCTKDDVMIGRYGPPIFQILRGIEGAYNVALIKAIPSEEIDKEFFYHFIKSEKLFKLMEMLSQRSSGQTGVELPALRNYPLALPPKEEQKAIAQALSDVDAAIAELDRLITKKRNIKQGTMQQLLTGKKRLPGFSGEWKVEKLDNISSEIGDGIHATPEYLESSEFYFINGNNLIDGSIKITERTKCVSEEEYRKYKLTLGNRTILMSINGTIGNIAFFKSEKVILGKSAAYINIKISISKQYIFYFLQTPVVNCYFEDELTGSTIRNLSLKSIRNTPILLPQTIEEQQAIAQVLSDMDTEIEALEQKRNKYKAIKQGMMQELLTGRTRLI